jgi:preprotein translocase subunit SecG
MDPEELRKKLKKGAIVAGFFALGVLFYALGWRGALVAYVMVVGILAVLAILIQSGRGGGLAASLGGLGGDSLLGTHSATPIAKATYVMLGLFIFIAMLVARMGAPGRAGAGLMGEPELPLVAPPGPRERAPEGGRSPEAPPAPANPGSPIGADAPGVGEPLEND